MLAAWATRADTFVVRLVLAISRRGGARIAEVAFLLVLIAGVWLAASQVPRFGWERARIAVSGVLLAAAGVLLIVAVHWGHFG
jgi:hypothetical protein